MRASVENGAGYGLMLEKHNQTFPFHFDGAADDPVFYAQLRALTTPCAGPRRNRSRPTISRRRSRRAAGASWTRPEKSGGWPGWTPRNWPI